MSKTPEFIEFAAIQIFVSLMNNSRDRYEVDAVESWRLAKMLYDAKPEAPECGSIREPLDVIRAQMQVDSDLVWTWHCNIAVAFMDEGGSHKQANEAAARFMLSAFGVDVRLSDQWKSMVAMINTDS